MPSFSVNFSDQANTLLEKLAENEGTSKADVLRQAISLKAWFDEQSKAGAKILVEAPDGSKREVIQLK